MLGRTFMAKILLFTVLLTATIGYARVPGRPFIIEDVAEGPAPLVERARICKRIEYETKYENVSLYGLVVGEEEVRSKALQLTQVDTITGYTYEQVMALYQQCVDSGVCQAITSFVQPYSPTE